MLENKNHIPLKLHVIMFPNSPLTSSVSKQISYTIKTTVIMFPNSPLTSSASTKISSIVKLHVPLHNRFGLSDKLDSPTGII